MNNEFTYIKWKKFNSVLLEKRPAEANIDAVMTVQCSGPWQRRTEPRILENIIYRDVQI